VRDSLLGLQPKDYDVATSATPQAVIALFGKRRTVPVGISFGVVMVLGHDKAEGQIEVATFRTDGDYSDGRRPDSVQFCSAEEDARRRDFTINGMFQDPLEDALIDYVGGERDLRRGIVRAIGDPNARFEEDKLRMLRAVRFAATLDFTLDTETEQSVRRRHQSLVAVSIERITAELHRMLAHPNRAPAVDLLDRTGLLEVIFPSPQDVPGGRCWSSAWNRETQLRTLSNLSEPRFEPALLMLLLGGEVTQQDATQFLRTESRRLKLSNAERDCLCWLHAALPLLQDISRRPLHVLKPLLAHQNSRLLLDLSRAIAAAHEQEPVDVQYCLDYLKSASPDQLAPRPLLSGDDVMQAGVSAGPQVRILLDTIRREQLDERLTTRESALQRLQQLLQSPDC
jgi:poly(A) polymerase